MNLGPPIDWAATGAMVTGLATFAGAGAVAFGAWFGANQWRNQKIAENQIEVAKDILRSAYTLDDDLDFILVDLLTDEDIEIYSLEEFGDDMKLSSIEFNKAAEILKSRMDSCSSHLIEFRSKRIEAKVVFGNDVWTKMDDCYQLFIALHGSMKFVLSGGTIENIELRCFGEADVESSFKSLFKKRLSDLEDSLTPVATR